MTQNRKPRRNLISAVLGVTCVLSLGFTIVYAIAEGHYADATGSSANSLPLLAGGAATIALFIASVWYRTTATARR